MSWLLAGFFKFWAKSRISLWKSIPDTKNITTSIWITLCNILPCALHYYQRHLLAATIYVWYCIKLTFVWRSLSIIIQGPKNIIFNTTYLATWNIFMKSMQKRRSQGNRIIPTGIYWFVGMTFEFRMSMSDSC